MQSYLRQIWENKHLILQAAVNRLMSPPHIKRLARGRLNVCKSCPFNSRNNKTTYKLPYKHCGKCGCSLGLKPYVKESKCPMGYWNE